MQTYDPQRKAKLDHTKVKISFELISCSIKDAQQQLLILTMKELNLTIDQCMMQDDAGTFILKKLGMWKLKNTRKQHNYLTLRGSLVFCLSYFNQRSLAYEPLIENYNMILLLNQVAPYTQRNIQVSSQSQLNINITYGMALVLKNIMNRMEESQKQSELLQKAEEGKAMTTEEYERCMENGREIMPRYNFEEMKGDEMVELINLHPQIPDIENETREPGVIFENNLGINLKLALHDEFCDENLESTLIQNQQDLTLRQRRSTKQDHQQITNPVYILNSKESLYKPFRELASLMKLMNTFKSGGFGSEVVLADDDPLRVDLKLQGLGKISSIPIESLGIHSYKLKFNKHNSVEHKTFFKSQEKLTTGIVINNRMRQNQKIVSFESQVIFVNQIQENIEIFVKSQMQDESELRQDQIAIIHPEQTFTLPLPWLISEQKLSLYIRTRQSVSNYSKQSQLLFKNLTKTFTTKLKDARLNQQSSQIIRLGPDLYTSMNITVYNCLPSQSDQNPQQYQISYSYPLILTNYTFQPMELSLKQFTGDHQTLAKLAPKETAFIDKLQVSQPQSLVWTIYDQDKVYQLQSNVFNFSQRVAQQSAGVLLEKFIQVQQQMEPEPHKLRMCIEVKPQYNHQANFELRKTAAHWGSSYQVIVYSQYMIVNKTSLSFLSYGKNQVFPPFSNGQLNVKGEKLAFKVQGYGWSNSIQINTVGLSGIIVMDLNKKEQVLQEQLPEQLEYLPQRLEFGLAISTAATPFNKTLIITITPRYQFINQLEVPIIIKQRDQKHQFLLKSHQTLPCFYFERKKDRHLLIREPSKDELIGLTYGKKLYTDYSSDEKQYWSPGFSIDDVDDFQIAYPKQVQNMTMEKQGQSWENELNRFVRVIISTENEANIQIVLAEPTQPEYQITNYTDDDLYFGQIQDDLFLKTLQKIKRHAQLEDLIINEKFIKLPSQSTISYAWESRDTSKKLIGIKLGNSVQEINLEKALKKTFICSADRSQQYQIEITVSGNSKRLKIYPALHIENPGAFKSQFLQKLFRRQSGSLIHFEVNLKGIGLSFIDEQPQELLYLSIYGISLLFQQWMEQPEDNGVYERNSKIQLSIHHLQLDNMINQQMPVILIPSKPLLREKKQSILVNGPIVEEEQKNSDIAHEMEEEEKEESDFIIIDEDQIQVQEQKIPFIQAIITFAETDSHDPHQPPQARLRTVQFAMQEFNFQIDTSIFTSNMKFVIELISAFQDQSHKQFFILGSEDSFEIAMHQKREDVCSELQAKMPNVVLGVDVISKISANKMFIELIHLGAIKANITFKLEKRAVELDVADPAQGFGMINLLYTFVAAVASISQTPINFKELVLIDTFATTESLVQLLGNNYARQGIMQFYKLLGSSDMIGNPVGLINKLGTGVYEFVSEPAKGLIQGPDEFMDGVGKGVQSLVSNVISGSFESMSKITGSLYTVVKNVSGEKNCQIRRTEHIGEGIYYGVKGGLKELALGVTGIVTKPIQKTREEGAKGFFKGLGSGIVGAITAPVTATLRAGTSVTQGVAASANNMGKYGRTFVDTNSVYTRFRAPRYFNARNVISEYDEDLALVRQILKSKYLGKYSEESIKYFTLLPLTRKNGVISNENQNSSILIITETMLFYFRLETSGKKLGQPHRIFKTRLRKIYGCELYKLIQRGNRRSQAQKGNQQTLFHTVITCYSQVKGKKSFTLVGPDYKKFETIYNLLSVLPFCEAVNRVMKQRNSKILS